MTKTEIDHAKVTQMLDEGYHVTLFRNQLGSCTAKAIHPDKEQNAQMRQRVINGMNTEGSTYHKLAQKQLEKAVIRDHFDKGQLITDDRAPIEALTRLAHKVLDGEIN
jgi:hypothetical protein